MDPASLARKPEMPSARDRLRSYPFMSNRCLTCLPRFRKAVLEIAHVACHQYSTVRVGNGGDLLVDLSCGPTRMAAGCDHLVTSSGGAVERQNPIGEA